MKELSIDPTTLAVLRGAFVSIAHDMSRLICRTSQSHLTAVLRDHHTGVYDASGQLIASSLTLPALAGTGRFQARLVVEKFKNDIYPGDEFIMNCPYSAAGTHLPDWTFMRPVYYKGEHLFWAFAKAHQQDTSGSWPGGYFPRAYDIHAEGIMIPAIKWAEKGKPITHVQELIMNNVRYPEAQRLDMRAMFASLKLAEERMIKLTEKYGKEIILGAIDQLINRMEKMVKSEIAGMPDGTYYAESSCDEDGTHPDKPVTVRCETTIKGDKLVFDYSKSDPQTDFISSPWSNTQPRIAAAFFTVLDPSVSFYHNEGSFRSFDVIAPLGLVVHAKYPVSVGGCPVNVGLQIFETVLSSLGQAIPDRATSGWARPIAFTEFGLDRAKRRYFTVQMNSHGGAGAIHGYDGWPHLGMFSGLGGFRKGSNELIETRLPWRITKYEMLQDSPGAGRWRGGHGVEIEWISDNDPGCEHTIITGDADGLFTDIYAVAGGQIPKRNRMYLELKATGQRTPLYSKRGPFFLQRGDRVIQYAQGGAGLGNPLDRDIELVCRDVKYEYISVEAARDIYKVAVDPETFEVDPEETRRLRSAAT
ncbi:MAG: hydantoinase B/oxoprolinase family protein [Desulfobacterales bacterium]|nr:hydantoinase B/oxoprolinase family protein [Desulfobacterales bacterium]